MSRIEGVSGGRDVSVLTREAVLGGRPLFCVRASALAPAAPCNGSIGTQPRLCRHSAKGVSFAAQNCAFRNLMTFDLRSGCAVMLCFRSAKLL
jgi:hypothetical protein